MTPGNMSPNQYVGADGTPNQTWEKTAAYADAMRRNEGDRIALAQIQNERAGRDPMASRALGQTMQAPGADAQSGATSRDEVMAQALRNLGSSNPGTRALGLHQLAAQNQITSQQMAIAKMNRETLDKQTEQGIAGNDSANRQNKELRERLGTIFNKPRADGNGSMPDEEKISDYISQVSSTMRHAGEEAKGDEKHLYYNGVTKKMRSPGELDDANHDRMRRLYEIGERVRSMAGSMPWNGPRVTTDDLRDWEPTQLPNGDFEMKRLTAKQNGVPFIVPASYLKYAQGAQASYMPSWGKTDTNRYTQNTQGTK
jgi:hypothetical protein